MKSTKFLNQFISKLKKKRNSRKKKIANFEEKQTHCPSVSCIFNDIIEKEMS